VVVAAFFILYLRCFALCCCALFSVPGSLCCCRLCSLRFWQEVLTLLYCEISLSGNPVYGRDWVVEQIGGTVLMSIDETMRLLCALLVLLWMSLCSLLYPFYFGSVTRRCGTDFVITTLSRLVCCLLLEVCGVIDRKLFIVLRYLFKFKRIRQHDNVPP
jgi:hypothetical protein